MLSVGSHAPDFALPGVENGEIGEFSLSEALREDVVVLAFYPADFSPTCTSSLCTMQDFDLLNLEADVTLFGISGDSVFSHRRFAEMNNITYPLLTDSIGEVAEEYGVCMDEWRGHRKVPQRSVVVIDDRQRVRYTWTTEDQRVVPELGEVRGALDDVRDDRTAIQRYARGFEHYDGGHDRFETAWSMYEMEAWGGAVDQFDEAVAYFDAAAESFRSAKRFSESAEVEAAAEEARSRSDDFRRAAKWYAGAAEHFDAADADLGAEYQADAEKAHESASTGDELRKPSSLFPEQA
ncbi:redoxin domain-containing protein [Haloarchaeobius sp. HME9146]|uniref:redoxin domain-containing protein n=1 Tax=Haloarchaeobius sp. HME9146 TaxID=2978732 RepID=UPI0021BE6584|nr:redoxin domain-containing protein [Haloarchaeobius sp. HME9146]MCT9094516.1 redoxin domain-containing protein [Haloarchaeobius sp. HME9146]